MTTQAFQWLGDGQPPSWCQCREHGPLQEQLRAAVAAVDDHSAREDNAGAPEWARGDHDQLRAAGASYTQLLRKHIEREAAAMRGESVSGAGDVAGWLGIVQPGPTGTCSIAAVRGLADKTTPEFRAKLLWVADQIPGMNVDWLARIISWETGGSFSPTARPIGSDGRPLSSAIGLLQFIKRVRDALGVTEQQLLAMTAVEQLDVVLAYYKKYAPRGVSGLCDAYHVVLAPDCRGRSLDHIVYPVGSDAYNANCPNPPCGVDPDGDGISCGDICRAIGGIPSARIDAPCSYAGGGASSGASARGGGGVLLALGVAAIGAVATFPLWRGYAGV